MNWTIGRKIIAAFALVMVLLLAFGTVNLTSTRRVLDYFSQRRIGFQILLGISGAISAVTDAETSQRGFLITGVDDYLKTYLDRKASVPKQLAELKTLSAGDSQRLQHIAEIEELVKRKFEEMDTVIAIRRSDGFEAAAKEVMRGHGQQDMERIRDIVGKFNDEENQRLKTLMDLSVVKMDEIYRTIIFGTLGASVALLLGGWLLARNISRPLAEMTAASERIASGELGGNIGAYRRSDEVGALAGAFSRMNRVLGETAAVARRIAAGDLSAEVKAQSERDELGTAFAAMQRNLREVMRETLEAVNVLSSAAAEINASVSQVAVGAAQTAAAITETTATVEEVKKTAELNSEKVRQVSESAQRSAQTSDLGRQSVEGTTAGMNRIRQQMDAVGASMIRLSEQTLAIGEIIATVNDLAEQSNILAVNASIEAAKAGEQGKGFAVVAQEVRSLAEQSKQATTQVRTMLNEIQKAASGAMLATEQGSKAVNAGLEQSEQAGHSIAALSESMVRSAQAAIQIAASSQQQAVGMDQVTIAIRNIQQATVQNAGIVKQVEESARLLHELGLKLKRSVERYKT